MNFKRLGSVRAPAGFSQRVMALIPERINPLDWGLLRFDHDDCVIIRDALRAAAVDRAPREPKDNQLVRNLFRLSHIFSDLADRS